MFQIQVSEINWDHVCGYEKGMRLLQSPPVIVTLGRSGQEDSEFETSLGYYLDVFSYVHSCCAV